LPFQSTLVPLTLIDKRLPQREAVRLVHFEDSEGGTANLRAADQHSAHPPEVTRPALSARVEQPDDVAR
jgi:hypothetical protein